MIYNVIFYSVISVLVLIILSQSLLSISCGFFLPFEKEHDVLIRLKFADKFKSKFDSSNIHYIDFKKSNFIFASAIEIFSFLTPYCLIVCGKRYRVLIFTKTYWFLKKEFKNV